MKTLSKSDLAHLPLLALLWLIAHLPQRARLALGRLLGDLYRLISKRRRNITRINLELCFPKLDPAARAKLLREVFHENILYILHAAMTWWGNPSALVTATRYKGVEHLERARAEGRGVLLLSAHITTLEFIALLLSRKTPFDIVYRRYNTPLIDRLLLRQRGKLADELIERGNLRRIIQRLHAGHVVWYAPDQDMGQRGNPQYVPFFGVPAITSTSTARIVGITNAIVIPFGGHFSAPNTYEVEMFPPLENFPTGDAFEDAKRINQAIEGIIRKCPAQYLWTHRRFKTHPKGKNFLYEQS